MVDWHGSIVREVAAAHPQVDADAFALAWRAGCQPAMEAVRSGGRGFVKLDVLHREILDGILPRFGLGHLGEAERAKLNRVWHRLAAWPDSVAGLTRHKARFTLCNLSNGNLGLQTAYIERPLEFGVAHPNDVSPQPGNTWHARNLLELADQLGA